jgi:hypothetical protein
LGIASLRYSKRLNYQQGAFMMTQAVAEHYDKRNEEKINLRQKQRMADRAAGIWKIDFGNV